MVKRKAVSKTRLKATRRKSGPAFKAKTEGKPSEVLLSQLMEKYLMDEESGASFTDILSGLGMNDRNTGWRKAWQGLNDDGLIEQVEKKSAFYTGDFRLTEKGRDEASTDELKQVMKAAHGTKTKTNEDLHKRIKGKLMNQRGEQIFDLLLKHGALSRKELAKHLKISDTGAYFSYALKQLKELGYAEDVPGEGGKGKKVKLTNESFVDPPVQEEAQSKAKMKPEGSPEVAKSSPDDAKSCKGEVSMKAN
ncbi:expressed unknown protein [Seminavis robusta]|uniref:Uncharacterized protein n=1 Tax=Seminavis robusta TaxID=568900 RepID=A0A9N8HU53_9STRA|nr:expressed unknown protein [Seminavis robusta]|eukprot:Sro1996_g310060.1 n/a (250) ;mRNA; f:12502-13251